ncbi:MAG TPA: NfeD family protein [Thiotrichales bacterium]|nr:NfeD family protein [Thiotrichales bacterium]
MAITIDFWHWWILALVLLGVEALAPGFFFLWMGVSAATVGLLLLLLPGLGWQFQVLCFAVLSVASIVVFKLWQRRHPPRTDQPALNRRGEQYIGRVLTLSRPVQDGYGEVRVDDTNWRVRGPDLPAGCRVRVVGTEGNLLLVEPAPPHEPAAC